MRWESYRPSSGLSLRSVVALGVLLALAPLASARAEGPDPPPYYAIRNVNVKTGSGQTLAGVTVLLADGLVEAVGAGVTVPADAWVIEGEGLTLFPGLIDALGDLGQKPKDQPPAGGMRGGIRMTSCCRASGECPAAVELSRSRCAVTDLTGCQIGLGFGSVHVAIRIGHGVRRSGTGRVTTGGNPVAVCKIG